VHGTDGFFAAVFERRKPSPAAAPESAGEAAESGPGEPEAAAG